MKINMKRGKKNRKSNKYDERCKKKKGKKTR